MKIQVKTLISWLPLLMLALTATVPVHAQGQISDRFANVNDVRLHYLWSTRF
jgi:hypothetical protein